MTLVRCHDLTLSFGDQVILSHTDLAIEQRDRICLLGVNGAGKSTLLRLIAREMTPDDGAVWHRDSLKVALLPQDVPPADDRTVYQSIASALDATGELLEAYHRLAGTLGRREQVEELARLQERIEAVDGWAVGHRIEAVLSRLRLPADSRLSTLSGGWLRRVALARALVTQPDVLLLDEPTNHLDIATIEWLEAQLLAFEGALVIVSHDRALIRKLATTIVELDRGQLYRTNDSYDRYLVRRDERRAVERRQHEAEDRRLRAEEAWLRQGVKARRRRNEGRVRKLKAMREERALRLAADHRSRMTVDSGMRPGALVKEFTGVGFSWGNRTTIEALDLRIMRGDRIGLVGANGVGKSTLLKLIVGEIQPDRGTVRSGTRLQLGYFDQLRERLDEERSAEQNLADNLSFIRLKDKNLHVVGYLERFLFTRERARTPVRVLSGGEKNRLLLAKLFSQPANLLLLDEPTNDLDVDTLELLEDLLLDYDGTVLLVTHDREFMNNVVTSTLVFEGERVIREYAGGYDDWLAQGGSPDALSVSMEENMPPPARERRERRSPDREAARLQRELETLPDRIEELEAKLAGLHAEMSAPGFYDGHRERVEAVVGEVAAIESALAAAYDRWDELES